MKRFLVLVLVLPFLVGCGGSSQKQITVLAASSLKEAFGQLGQQFEKDHGVKVNVVLNSSATLAQQAVAGAPGDVLATADLATMQSAVDGKATTAQPAQFASNVLVLVTPADNPAHITGIADLAKPGVKYVECVPTAPCGKVAAAVLGADHVTAAAASQEIDVKSVLAKVTSGDADAGLVYATDAKAAGADVQTIQIDGADSQRTVYAIAPLKQSKDATAAQQFIALVTSAQGQAVLAGDAFGTP